ncbi:MAG: TfoX/Sxy family protein [Roseiarcus sp.]|uniref:TfoX/Sxy family protein n=1 Tax=Roseiarcus sp. TaxID=1969460 RepID=UPI003C1F099E
MDREELEELFAPFAAVSVRRMFSGHGVYFDGLCFALSLGGDVYLKVDAETQAAFAAVDSRPFVYTARGREVRVGYWLAPPTAFDDEDELRRWASLAVAAAHRAAAKRTAKRQKARARPIKAAKRSARSDPGGRAGSSPSRRRPRH